MLADGVLRREGALANGTANARNPPSEFGESCAACHFETETRAVVLANGASAETFDESVAPCAFDNFAEFANLHGDQPEMKELPYPRASYVRHLPARIKTRMGIVTRKESAA